MHSFTKRVKLGVGNCHFNQEITMYGKPKKGKMPPKKGKK